MVVNNLVCMTSRPTSYSGDLAIHSTSLKNPPRGAQKLPASGNLSSSPPSLAVSSRPLLPNLEGLSQRRSSSSVRRYTNTNFSPSSAPATADSTHRKSSNSRLPHSPSISIEIEDVTEPRPHPSSSPSPSTTRPSVSKASHSMSQSAKKNGSKVVNYSAFLPPESGEKAATETKPVKATADPSTSVSSDRNAFTLSTDSYAGSVGGFMEGPLPPEVREIISRSFRNVPSGTNAEELMDEAERQSRRLLSSFRRVRVYREELKAAEAEVRDLAQLVQNGQLVCDALHQEEAEIDERIQQLLKEKELIQMQRQQEGKALQRQQEKEKEARERQSVLERTVDTISRELQTGTLTLRQLVPNLSLENYV